jgi:hypothetical protein
MGKKVYVMFVRLCPGGVVGGEQPSGGAYHTEGARVQRDVARRRHPWLAGRRPHSGRPRPRFPQRVHRDGRLAEARAWSYKAWEVGSGRHAPRCSRRLPFPSPAPFDFIILPKNNTIR